MSHEPGPNEWQRTELLCCTLLSPVIALEGLVTVAATTQEEKMAEKKSFEGEKREQDSVAFLFCTTRVSFLFCKSFPLLLRHTLGKSAI